MNGSTAEPPEGFLLCWWMILGEAWPEDEDGVMMEEEVSSSRLVVMDIAGGATWATESVN